MKNEIKIELKYCERCGGLWLRYAGSAESYCETCAPEMREMAVGRKKQPVISRRWHRTSPALRGVACA